MDLAGGEQLIFREHPSWRAILGLYLKGILLALAIGALIALVSYVADDEINWAWTSLAIAVIVVLTLLVGYVKRVVVTYTVTDRRLNIRRGVISRTSQESRLDRVQSITTSQSFLERLFGVGTVVFDTAEGEEDEMRFTGLRHPDRIVRALDRLTPHATTSEGGRSSTQGLS